MWRSICNTWRSYCVENPQNDMDKYLQTCKKPICSYELASTGSDTGKFLLTSIKWKSLNQMYFCSKTSTPAKEKQYLTLSGVVMKYHQSMALNSKDYVSVCLISVAKAFWRSCRTQWRRDFLKKPFQVVFAEVWPITSVHRFSGKNGGSQCFPAASDALLAKPAQMPLGCPFAAWLLPYTFKACWIFTCKT